MELRQFAIEGLGHLSAMIIDDAERLGAVVDPRRDVDVYLAAARERDVRISHVVETHLHNDFVSGARELAALTGARHVIGAGAELRYDHAPATDGETFDAGALRFTALATPGHTPEHMAYAVADRSRADEPVLLFSGGSLLVGAVGRTDLLGAETASASARRMFTSLHDVVLRHEDFVGVYPTHGGGSLCSREISATPSTTIGFERRQNPLLKVTDVEEFVRALVTGQPAVPRYFARMRALNQAGPTAIGVIPVPQAIPVERVRALLAGDHLLVDLRSPAEHAASRVPGSLSVPAGSSFGTWLGWVVPPDRPLIFLLDSPAEWDDAVRQALRIGYDSVAGYLHGGLAAWQASGGRVDSSRRLTVRELASALGSGDGRSPLVLDVRQRHEYEAAHVPGSLHLHAGDLPDRLAELPRDRAIATICASGYRSSVAASLLAGAGFSDVSSVSGGVPSWQAAGYRVEQGAGD